MCLSVVTKRTPRQRAVKVAYKLVQERVRYSFSGVGKRQLEGGQRGDRIVPSRWRKAKETPLRADKGHSYTSGFHVFAQRKDAVRMQTGSRLVVEVKVRGIHTVGRQWQSEVWVAREMFVSAVVVRKALAAGR